MENQERLAVVETRLAVMADDVSEIKAILTTNNDSINNAVKTFTETIYAIQKDAILKDVKMDNMQKKIEYTQSTLETHGTYIERIEAFKNKAIGWSVASSALGGGGVYAAFKILIP